VVRPRLRLTHVDAETLPGAFSGTLAEAVRAAHVPCQVERALVVELKTGGIRVVYQPPNASGIGRKGSHQCGQCLKHIATLRVGAEHAAFPDHRGCGLRAPASRSQLLLG